MLYVDNVDNLVTINIRKGDYSVENTVWQVVSTVD